MSCTTVQRNNTHSQLPILSNYYNYNYTVWLRLPTVGASVSFGSVLSVPLQCLWCDNVTIISTLLLTYLLTRHISETRARSKSRKLYNVSENRRDLELARRADVLSRRVDGVGRRESQIAPVAQSSDTVDDFAVVTGLWVVDVVVVLMLHHHSTTTAERNASVTETERLREEFLQAQVKLLFW